MPNEAMAALIRALLSNVPVWTLILALLLAVLQTRRAWRVDRWAEASLIWIAFWVLGIGGVYGFVAHLAFGPFLAEQIGWPNSPFQNEVAYANLTIGILGFSSVWYRAGTTCWQPWLLTEAGFLPTASAMLYLC